MKQAAILSYFARQTGPMPRHFHACWPGCAWHRGARRPTLAAIMSKCRVESC